MTQNSPEVLHIPREIQEDIAEKGFHLYNWISPDEVKISIEKDFLKTMKYVGGILAVISIIISLPFYGSIGGMITVFLSVIGLGNIFLFLYLLFVSLKRSFLLSKGSFVVLTDSSISLGGKIIKLSEISKIQGDVEKISSTFEENLFGKSRLIESKQKLSSEVMGQIFGGYKFLLSGNNNSKIKWGQGKDSEKFILLLILLYTGYVGVMSMVYFVGVFFLWIFGKVITWLNTKYLIYRGNDVMQINQAFHLVGRLSDDLLHEKQELQSSLKKAYKNEWKDGLLLEINNEIKKISDIGNNITIEAKKLRERIYVSRYKDMFESRIFHTWIKKQVSTPLKDIKKILEKNLELIEISLLENREKLGSIKKSEFTSALMLTIKRLEKQREQVEKFLPLLEEMILKLQ